MRMSAAVSGRDTEPTRPTTSITAGQVVVQLHNTSPSQPSQPPSDRGDNDEDKARSQASQGSPPPPPPVASPPPHQAPPPSGLHPNITVRQKRQRGPSAARQVAFSDQQTTAGAGHSDGASVEISVAAAGRLLAEDEAGRPAAAVGQASPDEGSTSSRDGRRSIASASSGHGGEGTPTRQVRFADEDEHGATGLAMFAAATAVPEGTFAVLSREVDDEISRGCVERARDSVLRFFAHPSVSSILFICFVCVMLGVVGWGLVIVYSVFGLFLGIDNGWNAYSEACVALASQWNQTLSPTYIPKPPNAAWGWSRKAEIEYCTSNQLYFNMAIKAFVVLFSYINFLPIPWSLAILHHSWCSNRFREPEYRRDPDEGLQIIGFDFYGVEIVHTAENKSIWFCLPRAKRRLIALLLNGAWAFHFACLAMHFVYQSYLEGQTWPGAFWQNIFFLLSIGSQMGAYQVQDRAEAQLRKLAGEMGRERRFTRIYQRCKCSLRGLTGAASRIKLIVSRTGRSTLSMRPVTPRPGEQRAMPPIPMNAQVSFSKSPVGISTEV
jgi:hypothetical protein